MKKHAELYISKYGIKKLRIPGNKEGRGFSIGTNGNLPNLHRQRLGRVRLTDKDNSEIHQYLVVCGTYQQISVYARHWISDAERRLANEN